MLFDAINKQVKKVRELKMIKTKIAIIDHQKDV